MPPEPLIVFDFYTNLNEFYGVITECCTQQAWGNASTKPLYLCSPFADAALVKGNFKTIIILPKYADIMEWVTVNSAFF